MNCEIICVGTELLLGDTVNTNSAFIATRLAMLGINVYKHTTVGDNPERLSNCIKSAFKSNDLVILTGGLGPTGDDITKETVAEFFEEKMVLNSEALQIINDYFTRTNKVMTENNRKQAVVPQNAIVMQNRNGTAPGIILEKNGKTAILLPGPPREMKAMFSASVEPYLSRRTNTTLVSTNIHLFGIGEAQAESKLKELMTNLKNPTLAPYAKDGEVLLRVTACAESAKEARKLISPVIEIVEQIIGKKYIYGIDIGNLQTALVKTLISKNLKIATAESCTGGLVSKRITDVSGASGVFECGVCSYSNRIKEQILGVSHATIEKYTEVSSRTAEEMADGIRKLSGADIGISTTGYAGPMGGTDDDPVGTVYIGISTSNKTVSKRLQLGHGTGNERDLIRYLAASRVIFEALRTAEEM